MTSHKVLCCLYKIADAYNAQNIPELTPEQKAQYDAAWYQPNRSGGSAILANMGGRFKKLDESLPEMAPSISGILSDMGARGNNLVTKKLYAARRSAAKGAATLGLSLASVYDFAKPAVAALRTNGLKEKMDNTLEADWTPDTHKTFRDGGARIVSAMFGAQASKPEQREALTQAIDADYRLRARVNARNAALHTNHTVEDNPFIKSNLPEDVYKNYVKYSEYYL